MRLSINSAHSFVNEKLRERLDLRSVSIFIFVTSSYFIVFSVGIEVAILVLYIYLFPSTMMSAIESSISLFFVIGFMNIMFACSILIGKVTSPSDSPQ